MTITDFLQHLAASRLALVGYTLMTGILFETLRLAVRGFIELRRARELHLWMLEPPHRRGAMVQSHAADIRHFLSETLLPIRYRLQTTETIAAYLGLGWTFLTYAVALPQAATLMKDDPDALFTLFGIGAGTSFLGVIVMILATALTRRMESFEERISALLAEEPGDDPGPRTSGLSPYRGKPVAEAEDFVHAPRGIQASPPKP